MTNETPFEHLKESELNSFIILYALKDYASKFESDKRTPEFVTQLEALVERYDKKCTDILIKRNLISGVEDGIK
jgi:hypothetical protein